MLIKQQHNVASNGTEYPLRLPRIMHEYVVLWVRRGSRMSNCLARDPPFRRR